MTENHHHNCHCGGHNHDHHHANHHSCGCGGHHTEEINPDLGSEISLQGELDASIIEVWNYLTNNNSLAEWNGQIEMLDFRPGGQMKVDFDGESRQVLITDIEEYHLLSFLWGSDDVAFTFERSEGDKTSFNIDYWMADETNPDANSIVNWLLIMYQLEHYLENDEQLDCSSVKPGLMENIEKVISEGIDHNFE